MSATSLPPEALQEIFVNLIGDDVLKCREVCKSWKAAVDDLSDSQWNKICENYMYSVYKKIHDKSSISWRDTYKALDSWEHIKSAKMECRPLPALVTQQFKVLPNRKIALLTNSQRDCMSRWMGLSDTIVYYNIDTLKELQRKKYEKNFRDYDENEHLILLICCDAEILLIKKANNKQEVVAKVYQLDHWHFGQFGLFNKKVYFQHEDGLIYCSELKETTNGEPIIKTAPLKVFETYHNFDDYVRAFGWADYLTVLTDYGIIYGFDNNEMGRISKLLHSPDVTDELITWGFDWTSPFVYHWLLGTYKDSMDSVKSKIEHRCISLHGPMVVLGTSKQRLVHLFLRPCTPDGELALQDAVPTRTIDMHQFARMAKDYNDEINQIDVVESVDHHLIVVLTAERVFLLKFGFYAAEAIQSEVHTEQKKVLTAKRKAESKNSEPDTKTTKTIQSDEKKMKSEPKLKTTKTIKSKGDTKGQKSSTKRKSKNSELKLKTTKTIKSVGDSEDQKPSTSTQRKAESKKSESNLKTTKTAQSKDDTEDQKVSTSTMRKAKTKQSQPKAKAKKVIKKPKPQKSCDTVHRYNTRLKQK